MSFPSTEPGRPTGSGHIPSRLASPPISPLTAPIETNIKIMENNWTIHH